MRMPFTTPQFFSWPLVHSQFPDAMRLDADMAAKRLIQGYINNFRRRITPYLRSGIGMSSSIYPAPNLSAVLEFRLGSRMENHDFYHAESLTLGKALEKVYQRAFQGDLELFRFTGTNILLEPGKIVLIKDSSFLQWTEAASEKDLERIIFTRIQQHDEI